MLTYTTINKFFFYYFGLQRIADQV